MNRFFSFGRIVSIAALAALAFARPAPAADDDCAFAAKGTSVASTDLPGARFEISLVGHANQGGQFTGTVYGKYAAQGRRQFGPIVLDFGGGDTLTVDTLLAPDPNVAGGLIGTYVVAGGTGDFEGATGSGQLIANPGAGTFELSGTVCD
jgi:hypothetical protein